MRASLRMQSGRHSRGIALAIVLWFIAGMGLLVAGIVLSARTDARLAQIHLQRAQATALGDGGINLLLADVVEGRFESGETRALGRSIYPLGASQVAVVALPAEWLIDINRADPLLWTLALRYSGTLSAEGAQTLADAVVQWRLGLAGAGARRFEALEDLLGVEGMNRTSWENVRDFVAIPRGGAGLTKSGPRAGRTLDRLQVLAPSQRQQAPDLLGPVDAFERGGSSSDGSLRVDALMQLGGRVWLRRRWVSMSNSGSGLPWRVVRSEPARIVTPLTARL